MNKMSLKGYQALYRSGKRFSMPSKRLLALYQRQRHIGQVFCALANREATK